jgi:hypothetical protein
LFCAIVETIAICSCSSVFVETIAVRLAAYLLLRLFFWLPLAAWPHAFVR